MADEPVQGAVPPVAANPAPTPPPQPVTPREELLKSPNRPDSDPQPRSDLDPGQRVVLDMPDGTQAQTTLQDLANSYTELKSQPKIDPALQKQFDLFQKAQAGDAESARALIDQSFPTPAPDPATPADERTNALQEQVNGLKETISRLAPTVDQITQMRTTSVLKQQIEENKAHLPFLAQHPQGAERTLQVYNNMKELAKQNGHDLANHPRHADVVVAALKHANAQIQQEYNAYQGFTPPQAAPNSTVVAVDDQNVPAGPGTQPPGAVQLIHGKWVDQWGRPMAPVAGPAPAAPLPTQMPEIANTPAAPGPMATAHKEGTPITLDQFKENLRRRSKELSTQ